MRKKTIFKRISVTKEIYDRLIKDRNEFQKVVGGGKWSISDTISEYFKIIDLNKNKVGMKKLWGKDGRKKTK